MLLKRLHRLHNSEPDENGSSSAVVDSDRPDDDWDEQDRASKEIDSETVDSEKNVSESEEKADKQADSDELIVTIEGEHQEDEEAKAPNWVKELRRKNREDQRRIRELEEKLAQGSVPKSDDPGKEPELEDFDYDPEAFKAAYKEWTAKKAQAERRKEEIRRQQEEVAKEWEAVQQTYAKGKARFPKEKMAEAEEEVVSVLPANRQAMLMDMADDSAALVVALGSSPETLRKLASIKSEAKFIKELTKIEMKIKVSTNRTPPPPERTISGSGKTPGAGQANLDRLREQAEKTGDYTEYYAAKAKAKAR